MYKKITKLLSLVGVIAVLTCSIGTAAFAADDPQDSWNDSNFMMAQASVDLEWNEPGYGLIYSVTSNNLSISPSYFVNEVYGKHVTSTSNVTDSTDIVARVIFAEAINARPRVDNSFAVAQAIKNRMIQNGSTAKTEVTNGQFSAYGSSAFLWPSNRNWDPQFDESNLTQEELFVECCYLAKCLNSGYAIPTKDAIGRSVYTSIGNRRFFYHIKDGDCPFYQNANYSGQCTPSNISTAKYYQNQKITTAIQQIKDSYCTTKIGWHVYYNR